MSHKWILGVHGYPQITRDPRSTARHSQPFPRLSMSPTHGLKETCISVEMPLDIDLYTFWALYMLSHRNNYICR